MIFPYLHRQRERPPDDRLFGPSTDHRIGDTRSPLPYKRITPHPKGSHLRTIHQINPNASRQDYSSEEPLPPVQEAKIVNSPAVRPQNLPEWNRCPTPPRT